MSTEEWIIEHNWRCSSCKHINLGRDKKCVNCGGPKENSDEEIISNDMSQNNAVTDSKLIKQFKAGPDWICAYCNHHETKLENKCSECGSDQGEKKSDVGETPTKRPQKFDSKGEPDYFHEYHSQSSKPEKIKNPEYEANSDGGTTITVGTGYRQATVNIPPPPPPPPWYQPVLDLTEKAKEYSKQILIGLLVILTIAGFVWLMYYLFAKHETNARIVETHWRYNVSLRERRIFSGRDWQGSMHSHHFNESCQTEIRSYHNCNPYSCNPHSVSYSCNCRTTRNCTTVCSTSCSSNRNGSSTCRRSCSPSCSSSTSCSTCYRTEYDTCYHRCPDYDQMCSYQYPDWPVINQATLGNGNHTIVRPNLTANSGLACVYDNENLYTSANATQCTEDSVNFNVSFDAGDTGHWSVQPSSLAEYNHYTTGSSWRVEYNRAGSFRPLYLVH
jgi:hypothetical protein